MSQVAVNHGLEIAQYGYFDHASPINGPRLRRILACVVRPGRAVAPWVPADLEWEDETWDLAVLSVESEGSEAAGWDAPSTKGPPVVRLGVGVEPQCQAVGFPEFSTQRAVTGHPAEVVRQSGQVVGVVALPGAPGSQPLPMLSDSSSHGAWSASRSWLFL